MAGNERSRDSTRVTAGMESLVLCHPRNSGRSFCGYSFSFTTTASKGLSLRFSGRCTEASLDDMICPAFGFDFLRPAVRIAKSEMCVGQGN